MRRLLALVLVGSLLSPRTSAAQSADDEATAEILFREGQALFDRGEIDEACRKFAASYALAGGLGTLGNLARCHEAAGRTASAWALYADLLAQAERAGQTDRADIARERVAVLEPKLMRLRIVLREDDRVEGLVLERDGRPILEETYGVPVPVDPGRHEIAARADGYTGWTTTVEVAREGQVTDVVVPRLEPASPKPVPPPAAPLAPRAPIPAPPPSASLAPEPASEDATLTWLGAGAVGLGAVGVGIGIGFGVSAASSWDDADCKDGLCPTPEAQVLSEDANQSADIASGFMVAGVVIGTAGLTLLLVGLLHDDVEQALHPRAARLRF